jgi:hypothetical protein
MGGKIERCGPFGHRNADGPGAGHLNRPGAGVVQTGMTKKIAERSRRAPGDGKRNYRVAVRFTESELARIEVRAVSEGLVTAAWVGIAALAMADPEAAAGHASREELDDLVAATEQVRRAGYLLNQAVMTMHALKQVRPAVEFLAVRVWQRVEALDEAAIAVAGQLRRTRWRR